MSRRSSHHACRPCTREPDLHEAIKNLHGCDAVWVETAPVTEVFQGRVVWDGQVEVFDVIDHPTATRCYAWAHHIDESEKRRFVVVLGEPPVDSPKKAVQAAIAGEYREDEA